MKIVKEGKLWEEEFVCTGKGGGRLGCKAVLLVSEEDLYIIKNDDESYSLFSCPCCGAENCITVPYGVRHLGKRPEK